MNQGMVLVKEFLKLVMPAAIRSFESMLRAAKERQKLETEVRPR